MRILMLAQNYPPIAGGEEQHVRNLSVELVRRGHQVAVVCLRDGSSPDFEVDEGVRIYRVGGVLQRIPVLFSTRRRFAPPFPDPETTRSLWRIIQKERPEIVHAHNWLVYAFLPLKRRSGARLVLSLHDYSLVCPQKRLMYHNEAQCTGPQAWKCLECASSYYGVAKGVMTVVAQRAMKPSELRAVDRFLPVSQAVADQTDLIGSGVPYEVVPNFVSDGEESLRPESARLLEQLPTDDFVLFVGDLSRDKGVYVLLEAAAALAVRPPVVLVGRMCRDTPTETPPHVTIIPGLPHDAVIAAFRRALFAVAPSICREAFGIVAIEAMAAGKPVIASRAGGLIDIVAHGETGLLTAPGSAQDLRDAMAQLIASPLLRAQMGAAGKERVKRFRALTVAPQIEAVYQALTQTQTQTQAAGSR